MENENLNTEYLNLIKTFFSNWTATFYAGASCDDLYLVNKTKLFFDNYQIMKRDRGEIGLISAPEFNIFQLLNVVRSEIASSVFIANLLNPNGTHGQRDLFINYFLKHFTNDSDLINSTEREMSDWRVHTEMSFSEGRCDIVAMNSQVGILFVIENKIDASEQDNQLRRYYKWMKSGQRFNMEYRNQYLFYLTPSGKKSGTLSEGLYKSISYRTDIANWLTNSLEEVKAPGVKEVIKQYIRTISSI